MAIKSTTWALIEKAWKAGEISISEIARRYSVSVNGIKDHAKRYYWGERPNKGHKIIFQSKQTDQVIQDQSYDANKKQTIDESHAIEEKHKLLGSQLTDRFFQLMNNLDLSEMTSKEKAQTLQVMSATLEKIQKIERLTYGLSDKPKEEKTAENQIMSTDQWAKVKHLYMPQTHQDDDSFDVN